MIKEALQVMTENPEVTGSALVAFGLAFSVGVRKAIGARDKWHCQEEGCDASFQNGDMVHAAHNNHDKSDPAYDTVDAGKILCVPHHLKQHQEAKGHAQDIGLQECQNDYAIARLLVTPTKKKKGV